MFRSVISSLVYYTGPSIHFKSARIFIKWQLDRQPNFFFKITITEVNLVLICFWILYCFEEEFFFFQQESSCFFCNRQRHMFSLIIQIKVFNH